MNRFKNTTSNRFANTGSNKWFGISISTGTGYPYIAKNISYITTPLNKEYFLSPKTNIFIYLAFEQKYMPVAKKETYNYPINKTAYTYIAKPKVFAFVAKG